MKALYGALTSNVAFASRAVLSKKTMTTPVGENMSTRPHVHTPKARKRHPALAVLADPFTAYHALPVGRRAKLVRRAHHHRLHPLAPICHLL